MKKHFLTIFLRVLICIALFIGFLYTYISKQNQIVKLRLEIPQLAKKVEMIEQENTHLKFEIDQFENPLNLMEIARQETYRHLKHPKSNEILTIETE